ncbi:MAG TPA: hypothetical protein VFL12_00120 [Thermoanaerobaculia bacterium]|nr:hypothetical protein [Thermoanaerobaculia bacterium]
MTDPRPDAAAARRAFLVAAALTAAAWIAIAAGMNGERDGDSRAWLTCFTFWAPASYLLVVGRRPWTRRTILHPLLVAAAGVVLAFDALTIAGSSSRFPRFLRPAFDGIPAFLAIPAFYLALGSLFAAPLLSVAVFLFGRRRIAGDPASR